MSLNTNAVQFGCSVMSDSLQMQHGMQHVRPPCPSPTPLSITNSRSLLKFMPIESVMLSNHLILSCPLLLLPSIFSSIRIFSNESALHTGNQSIGVSASPSVLPMNIQDWFPLGLTGLISLQFKGPSRVFSNTTVPKHQFFSAQLSLQSNSHIHTWLLGKAQLWLDGPLSAKQCLCFLICCLGWS